MTALAQTVVHKITSMDDNYLDELLQFMAFLDFRQKIEDAKDVAYATARENEPSIPSKKVREILGL